MKLNIIVAVAKNMGIGLKGKIPWHLKKDMAVFAQLTKSTNNPNKKNAVIMGRKTWDSIPERNKPLSNRLNIVLSTTLQGIDESVKVCQSLKSALEMLQEGPYAEEIENIWIIGGASVYREAMDHSCCHRIYITRILEDFECDVFMPSIDFSKFTLVTDSRVPHDMQNENGISFKFEIYERNMD